MGKPGMSPLQSHTLLTRVLLGLTSGVLLSSGCMIAAHYPLGDGAAIGLFLVASILAFLRPAWFLVIIPATIPLIGLAPWTGWLALEEFDLLVLAVTSGGYLRIARDRGERQSKGISQFALIVVGLLMLSSSISMARGFADAGGFEFAWYQGYDGPMNSIRIAKGFFLAALWAPLIAWLDRRNARGTSNLLALGMAGGCLTASLVALMERIQFTGLLNFSTDYRTTGPFWEMHVGGAALDGWLLLSFPFVVWMFHSARNLAETLIMAAVMAIAGYAALTTFSRGVFLGLVVSFVLMTWLDRNRHKPDVTDGKVRIAGSAWQVLALTTIILTLGLAFVSAGYRGMLAMLLIVSLLVVGNASFKQIKFSLRLAGLVIGLPTGLCLSIAANFLTKGPYWVFVLSWLVGLFCIGVGVGKLRIQRPFAGIIAFTATLVLAANVAGHWGGIEALPGYLLGLLLPLLLVLLLGQKSPAVFDNSAKSYITLLFQAGAASAVIAMFVGGAYVSGRFATTTEDLAGRFRHWSTATKQLESVDDWLFGKGLGRFPANYRFVATTDSIPGTILLINDQHNTYVSLRGPQHPIDDFGVLRFSQRLASQPVGPFKVEINVRSQSQSVLHFEVCDKHLLYPGVCISAKSGLLPGKGAWQHLVIPIDGVLPASGLLFKPYRVFSLGLNGQGQAADVANVRLLDAFGNDIIQNQDFSSGLAHWFFTSDRDHLPWHAKSLVVNVLYDQGLVGLALTFLLLGMAITRALRLVSDSNELGVYWLAAFGGFLAVGLFDSVLDVPRLAFTFFVGTMFLLVHRSGTPGRTDTLARKLKDSHV